MADSTSKGTFGLSHYKNSRAAQSLYEPVYKNYFTIQISLPPALGATPEDTNLLLENIQKISGLESNSFIDGTAEQKYKWASRRFAKAKPSKTTMDISMDFEVNLNHSHSAYVLKTLRKWNDLVYDPLTGRTGLKMDYVAPSSLITLYDRASNPFWQWRLYNIFPISAIPAIELDYNADDIFKITGYKLACDSWDETII